MAYIDVVQGTDVWLEYRAPLLSASVAAPAAGLKGAYSSRNKCWEEYMGKKKEVTSFMQFGTDHEQDAKHDGETAIGSLSHDVGIYIHPDHDWLGASPDGLFIGLGLHEIKCRDTEPYAGISSQHMAQIQVQLACAEEVKCVYQSWTPLEQRIWIVEYSPEYWACLFPLLEEFWEYVSSKTKPPQVRPRRVIPVEPTTTLFYEGAHDGIRT